MNQRDQLEHVKEQVKQRAAETERMVIHAVSEAEAIEKEIRKAMAEVYKAAQIKEEPLVSSVDQLPLVTEMIQVAEEVNQRDATEVLKQISDDYHAYLLKLFNSDITTYSKDV